MDIGGNGLNHPTSYAGAYVYRTVIDSVRWLVNSNPFNKFRVYQNSYWYAGGYANSASNTGTAISANQLYFMPFLVEGSQYWKNGALNVLTAAAGANARMGIYNSDGIKPTTLLSDFGTVSVAATGAPSCSFTKWIPAGLYFVCVVSDGAPVLAGTQLQASDWGAATVNGTDNCLIGSHTYGALPAVATAVTRASRDTPNMFLAASVLV